MRVRIVLSGTREGLERLLKADREALSKALGHDVIDIKEVPDAPDVYKVRAMPGTPMTSQEMADQCAFVSKCLDAGVDQIREDDEWETEDVKG